MIYSTYTLLLVNIGIFAVVFASGFWDRGLVEDVYSLFGLIPAKFLEGAFWQPFTSLFLHYPFSPFHILCNMIGLWSFGATLERSIGTVRFLFLYFISGLSGSLFVVLLSMLLGSPQEMILPTVGSSGSIAGLLGAMAVLFPNAKLLLLFFPMKASIAALLLGIISLVFSFMDSVSFISHYGHLGGLIGGFIYAKIVLLPESHGFFQQKKRKKKSRLIQNLLSANSSSSKPSTGLQKPFLNQILPKKGREDDSNHQTKEENFSSQGLPQTDVSPSPQKISRKESNEPLSQSPPNTTPKQKHKTSLKLLYNPKTKTFYYADE